MLLCYHFEFVFLISEMPLCTVGVKLFGESRQKKRQKDNSPNQSLLRYLNKETPVAAGSTIIFEIYKGVSSRVEWDSNPHPGE
jgi:hypothetical protein